jgi:hypothetical protein
MIRGALLKASGGAVAHDKAVKQPVAPVLETVAAEVIEQPVAVTEVKPVSISAPAHPRNKHYASAWLFASER